MKRFNNLISKITDVYARVSTKIRYCLIIAISSLTTSVNLSCNNLFTEAAGQSFLTTLQNVYNAWFFPLLMFNGIFFAVSKDEKRKGIFKSVCIGLIVVYILLGMKNTVESTFTTIRGWFGA